jgi:hypothetical protein
MANKVRSVRVPPEIETLDLTGLVRECARHVRDLESAALLSAQGETAAAEALLRARQAVLGRRVGALVLDAAKRARAKVATPSTA